MTTFSATEARNEFKEILNRAAYGKERLRITSHGKVVAAMVPIEDLELLEKIEDRIDREDAEAALAEAKAGMIEAGAVTLEEFDREIAMLGQSEKFMRFLAERSKEEGTVSIEQLKHELDQQRE